MRTASLLLACVTAISACACSRRDPAPDAPQKRLVILGIDGMDPELSRKLMRDGRMPNLEALTKRGSFSNLGTSTPPESPVAWSDFITGQRSDGHGIYDFVHRDAKKMAPYLSTSRVSETRTVRVGSLTIPVGGGEVELLRGGRPFWSYLGDAGVPASLYMIPASYPPRAERGVHVIAGMGTPDLLGTYGVFQLFTDDPGWKGRTVAGGDVHEASVARGRPTTLSLLGPESPFSPGERLSAPLEIVVDEHAPAALVRVGGHERLMKVGEWSDWIPVSFEAAPLGASTIDAMVQLHLRSVDPYLSLYVSPLNIDPLSPAQPFATEGAAEGLAKAIGRFHTLGIPEDSKALESGALSDEEFLVHANAILEERRRVLDHALQHFDAGVLFVYFGSIDQISHTFWRTMEPDAPLDLKPLAGTIPALYARIDGIVGDVASKLGDTPLVVMSDHGFAPYRTKFHLNAWLRRNGYLTLREGASETTTAADPLREVDWSKTRAYALGLNLLYVNLRGREADGVVAPEERDALVAELQAALEKVRDPVTGDPVITRVAAPGRGAFPERAPDLVVGYGRGYRSSDVSAVGAVSTQVFEGNRDKWRGDHCMDAALVPGLVATTLPVDLSNRPELVDLAPTILDYFGVDRPATFAGKSLLVHRP